VTGQQSQSTSAIFLKVISQRSMKIYLYGLCLSIVVATSAWASAPNDITDNEIALLPKYCPYTQSFKSGIGAGMKNTPQAEAWLNTVGPGFWHLHHYCWARIDIQRSERRNIPSTERRGYREAALGNLWYVVKNSPDDLILLPEIFTWIGRVELTLDHPAKAQEAFAHAWTLKEDYWPPYYHWGEYLLSKGKKPEATSVAKSGLEHSPDAKPLNELLKRLNQTAK
jgi:hypothetical protein